MRMMEEKGGREAEGRRGGEEGMSIWKTEGGGEGV